MSASGRVILDTNVVVSGLLFPQSVPAAVLLKAQAGVILSSAAIRSELAEVLARPRFDRYATQEIRKRLVAAFVLATTEIAISEPIRVCRDPRDNKFIEAAIYGHADAIVTGDGDLLALDPFQGVRIVTPAEFLEP